MDDLGVEPSVKRRKLIDLKLMQESRNGLDQLTRMMGRRVVYPVEMQASVGRRLQSVCPANRSSDRRQH